MVAKRSISKNVPSLNAASKKLKSEMSTQDNIRKEDLSSSAIKIEGNEFTEKAPNDFDLMVKSDLDPNIKYPANWMEMYNEIAKIRGKIITPVDRMGCERIPEGLTEGITHSNPRAFRFQLLISLILSSQTKDEVNFEAMRCFHQGLIERGFQDGLVLEAVLTLTESEIDSYIKKVGFHNKKSKYIKDTCIMLKSQFGGDVPSTIEDLTKLPGVGPKMGFLLLQRGWNKSDGIGVDVHIHRLAQLWNWVSDSKNPESTRVQLEAFVPKKFWSEINPLLVGFGQSICVPKSANCDICSLGKLGFCKRYNRKLMGSTITDSRKEKLSKGRADFSKLIADIEDLP